MWNWSDVNTRATGNENSALIQVMAWCRQTTIYYLNQYWVRSTSLYGVTRSQWIKLSDRTNLSCIRIGLERVLVT